MLYIINILLRIVASILWIPIEIFIHVFILIMIFKFPKRPIQYIQRQGPMPYGKTHIVHKTVLHYIWSSYYDFWED